MAQGSMIAMHPGAMDHEAAREAARDPEPVMLTARFAAALQGPTCSLRAALG